MSQANIDLYVEGIKAFNRGDVAAVLGGMDPDIKFEHRLAAVGVEAVKEWLLDAREHLEAGQIDCSDVRDLGDRVLALGTLRAIGKESGAAVELPYTVLATFRDGRITQFIDFGDREKALEAAGLRE